MTLSLRYKGAMLMVLVVDQTITATFIVLSERLEILPVAASLSVLLLGVVNVCMAHLLFRPIGVWLDGRGDAASATRRLRHLLPLSTAWALILAFIYAVVTFLLGVFTPDSVTDAIPLADRVLATLWFLFVYMVYMGIVAHLAVRALTEDLRVAFFARGVPTSDLAGTARLSRRLALTAVVVTVMPLALVVLDLTVFRELRAVQGLSVTRTVLLDLVSAGFAAAIALFLLARSLIAPVRRLVDGQAQVGEGNVAVRLPVTTDDELGLVTDSFNTMAQGLQERAFVRDALSRYVGTPVADALLSAGQKGETPLLAGRTGEATVLFIDIENFSEAASSMAPDAVLHMLNVYLELVTEPIEQSGGIISNYIGDAVLASFNLPLPNVDHAAGAVTAALAIQNRLASMPEANGGLNARIGINTGNVVAGSVGTAERMSYTVLGATVNLAARLEALNKRHGTRILVGPETWRQTRHLISYRSIGEVEAKGEPKPVPVFEPLGVIDPPTPSQEM